jgi:hypothetical protein
MKSYDNILVLPWGINYLFYEQEAEQHYKKNA